MKRFLIVDIGNTRAKFAVFEQDHIKNTGVFTNIDEIKNFINEISAQYVIISSVGKGDLTKFVINEFPTAILLNEKTPIPIINEYTSPETLGKDRLANAVAANHLYANNNCLIIDAGTCLKFDFITKEGHYLGGGISPGLSMRFKSVYTFTDKLPLVSSENGQVPFIGTDTRTSLQVGCYRGFDHEISATIDWFKENYDNLKVLITGGDLQELQKMEFSQKNSIFADRWLTLRGLYEILKYNVKI